MCRGDKHILFLERGAADAPPGSPLAKSLSVLQLAIIVPIEMDVRQCVQREVCHSFRIRTLTVGLSDYSAQIASGIGRQRRHSALTREHSVCGTHARSLRAGKA